VTVTKLAVTPGFDFGAYIEKSTQSIALTQSDTLASRLKLDLHVSTTPELQMQTAVARLSGNADLKVRGTADRPAILGRVEVLEGDVTFNGNKYKLERGDVTFANPPGPSPSSICRQPRACAITTSPSNSAVTPASPTA